MKPDSAVGVMESTRRKPYTAKTMDLYPLAATGLRCIEQPLKTKRSGAPSAKEDLETVRFCVFAAPGLCRALTAVLTSTGESGMNPT